MIDDENVEGKVKVDEERVEGDMLANGLVAVATGDADDETTFGCN